MTAQRFRIFGMRPYLREDGKETWGKQGWRVSKGFDVQLSEVLRRTLDLAMRSAETRGRRFLRAEDLELVETALDAVGHVVAKRRPGYPRSAGTADPGYPTRHENVSSNPRTVDLQNTDSEDSTPCEGPKE